MNELLVLFAVPALMAVVVGGITYHYRVKRERGLTVQEILWRGIVK